MKLETFRFAFGKFLLNEDYLEKDDLPNDFSFIGNWEVIEETDPFAFVTRIKNYIGCGWELFNAPKIGCIAAEGGDVGLFTQEMVRIDD